MTRVLFIAYHFPPIGGGGVQRNAKFARYLPELGFEPVVVTGPGRSADRWAPDDASLLAEIDGLAEVHRLAGPEPAKTGRRAAAARKLGLVDRHTQWWVRGAQELARPQLGGVDLIYASLIPYDTAEAAAALSRESGLPWIADLQDPWALDEMWIYPSALHRRRDLARMRRLLGTAAAVVMNTPEAANRLVAAFPELSDRLVVSIPNGFDASDFPPRSPAATNGRFRIVHTGYLHTDHGLRLRKTQPVRRVVGGTATRVDILPRSHLFLLRALDALIERDPALDSVLEVVLAGVTTETDRAVAAEARTTVSLPGYLSHTETVRLMQGADLLFLPMHDLPSGERAGLVPGKTYEYLAARRPILAAVPDGDARDLLVEVGSASVCSPTDVDAMTEIVGRRVAAWRAGEPAPQPREEVLARYERRQLTRRLADVLEQVRGA